MFGGIVHALKRNTDALVVASKENGIDVNADNYMVMSRDQNAGQSQSIMVNNCSFGRVERFKYLGTTLKMKILFGKKSRADWSQGMLASIRCRIACLPVSCKKYKYTQKYIIAFCFMWE